MAELVLPAVAKSVLTECKKCGAERYHTVLAHTSATAAKVQCEICKAKKTFKLETPKKAKAAKAPGTGKPRVSTPRGATAKAAAYQAEYENLTKSAVEATPYMMKSKFVVNQKIQHPKFGVGVVKTAFNEKVEVIFQDEVRSLVHNRA